MKEGKVDINGVQIHYEKVGQGPVVLLLLPSGLAAGRLEFSKQFNGGLDPGKFTIITWDPPGCGQSRPPLERKYTLDMYSKDADLAAGLMKNLGFNTYSVVGFEDGALTAILTANRYQGSVDKLVVWGVYPYSTAKTDQEFLTIKDTTQWSPDVKNGYLNIYGEDFKKLWSKQVNFYMSYLKSNAGIHLKKDILQKIQCSTLILHGVKDTVVVKKHIDYLSENLSDSRVHRFPEGGHYLHQANGEQFNLVIQKFLND